MQIEKVLQVERRGLCGNEVCEWGEQQFLAAAVDSSYCARDCTRWQTCPAPALGSAGSPSIPCGGRGRCTAVTGACECHVGYTGHDCGACNSDYILQDGWCMPKVLLADFVVREAEIKAAAASARDLSSNTFLAVSARAR